MKIAIVGDGVSTTSTLPSPQRLEIISGLSDARSCNENLTSSEVSGSPLWNVAPLAQRQLHGHGFVVEPTHLGDEAWTGGQVRLKLIGMSKTDLCIGTVSPCPVPIGSQLATSVE